MAATPQGSQLFQERVESVCRAFDQGKSPKSEDFRSLMNLVTTNLQAALPGGNLLTPGGTKTSSSAPPTGASFKATGANGAVSVAIQNPAATASKAAPSQPIYHEVSYSPLKSFTANVTTLPHSTQTNYQIPSPGNQFYVRFRSSFDKVNWSPYQIAVSPVGTQEPVAAGLLTSGATSDATAFNQTNFGVVTSTAVGPTAEVSVQGPSGAYTALTAQKGPTQKSLPGATIYGVTPGSNVFVGYHASGKYVIKATLAGVLSDDQITPVGKASVVNTGNPTLPTIVPIVSGGQILGYNVTNGGNGASGPYTLTLNGVGGSGATFGPQTIQNGVLISVGPGNPGSGYASATVTASGGTGVGQAGGGTANGGNGGRMTNV